ncbi:OLC1v1009924C1 [Oldenlandia corymbosa var. corymbosa]|uniref:60S ribosomal export protein NMD3 n=1 Tax=Oldenlandia corymbosa var. corymbosa TaxID=529605 RepID=A0AAV1DSQ6_OLDCO|nr:OLC1v1009924C1 [Oldenlandia corymbosa var. corymbosa]
MCDVCFKVQTDPGRWITAVQVRLNHVSHRRTFFHLEQLILKHDAAVHCVGIKQIDQGRVEFVLPSESLAMDFVEFLAKVNPIKPDYVGTMSYDAESDIHKSTLPVEICAVCPGDLISLPPEVAASLGYLGPVVICTKITDCIVLMEPVTIKHRLLDADQYWRSPLKTLFSSADLVRYVVVDIEPTFQKVSVDGSRYQLADVIVDRRSDNYLEKDTPRKVRTHLGHVLDIGMLVLGYAMSGKYKGLGLPDVVLIRKFRWKREKPRTWELKRLVMEVDDSLRSSRGYEEKIEIEYEELLEELEMNPDIWSQYSFYKNKYYQLAI